MHLLVITREFPQYVLGGISYHLANLYGEVCKRGHEITVITGKCPQSKRDLVDQMPDIEELHAVEFGHRKGYQFLFPFALLNFLHSFETAPYDACIAHTEVPFDIDLPLISKKHDCFRAVRSFVLQRLNRYERVADRLVDPVRQYIDRQSLIVSGHLIFNSNLCRDAWSRHYDFSTTSHVIYNGVDIDRFYPRAESPEYSDDYLLFVGNCERKGLSTMIELADCTEHEVIFVGPSDVDAAGATALGRVSQNELAKLYSHAIATIHPAHFEAFGNVVLESVACGTPVVTTEMCGAAEILDDNICVTTDNLKHGVAQAQQLDSQDCVKAAREYSWEDVADRTIDTVCDVANRTTR